MSCFSAVVAAVFLSLIPNSSFAQFSTLPFAAAAQNASMEDSENPDHPTARGREPGDAQPTERRSSAIEREPAPDPDLASPPDAPIVRAIEISGATPEEAKKARRVLETREGEPLNPTKQRNDIRHLYDLGLFKSNILVQADKVEGGVRLRYQVEQNPKVAAINVSGNQQIATKKIISELPVKKGETYTIQAQNKIRDQISKYYEDKGYSDALVRVVERPAANNGVDLDISVDEGTKTKIKDLIVRGNNSVSSLPIKFRAHNKGSWGPFKHYYNESKFQDDLQAVKAVYLTKGFLDVEVRRGEFEYAPDQSWVNPVIEVQEGQRYRIGRIDARGYSVFGRDEVVGAFKKLEGDYYNVKSFNLASDKVKNMYGDEGFLVCRVTPDFHKDSSRGVVDVDLDITEGPRIYVGDVKVVAKNFPEDSEAGWLRRFYSRMTPPVQDDVIRREVRLRPGQVYRRFEEVKTRERLKSLSIFDDVKVQDQLSVDSNVRDCVVDVTQGNTGNLIFGVGFGDVEGIFFYANYIEHNLFGLARDLRVSGLIGSSAQSFDISYLDRWFMGRDLEALFSVFHHQFLRTGDIEQTETGGIAEFTRPLSECLKDSFRIRLAAMGFDLDDDDDKPEKEIEDYVAATLRYRLLRDTRDDAFFPTTGNIMGGTVETGSADGLLLKLEGQYATYFCLGENWVAAMNTKVGFLPYNAENIGYGERLFLGGSQDLRGFRIGGAGPHDSRNEDIPIGGATKVLSQFEMRYPFTEGLVGVLFADVGMLNEKPISLSTPRLAVGPGMRLRMPIAQIALDLGIPVIKQKEDQTQVLHFTMTSQF